MHTPRGEPGECYNPSGLRSSPVDLGLHCRTSEVTVLPLALSARIFLAGGALLACKDTTGQVLPDFTLQDENPVSASYLAEVSPRDKLDKVSAWYFGHST